MRVYGEYVSQDTIDSAWRSITSKRFTCGDIEDALRDLGVANVGRTADRMLQKKRKAIEIHFSDGWWWFIDIKEEE